MRRNSMSAFESVQRGQTRICQELNTRLEDIFAHHRGKEEKLADLEKQNRDVVNKYEGQIEIKEKQHSERIAVFQKQLKQLETRRQTLLKRMATLEKQRDDAVSQCVTQEKHVSKLTKELSEVQKELSYAQTQLRDEGLKHTKVEFELTQTKQKLNASVKISADLEETKNKITQELTESHQLQTQLTNLIEKREKEVKTLEESLKEVTENQANCEEELKDQFQEELNKYIRLRDNQYEQEKTELINVLKEEHKKNLIQYKEALGAKNHDIETLKESTTRLKHIIQNLKNDKEEIEKEKEKWKKEAKDYSEKLETTFMDKDKMLKEKEVLLQDLREKYMDKSEELDEITAKHNSLQMEINAYRSFIEEEEKALGYPHKRRQSDMYRQLVDDEESRMHKRRKISKAAPGGTPIPQGSTPVSQGKIEEQCVPSTLELSSFDLNKSEVYIKNVSEEAQCLTGWSIVNADRTHRFDLPEMELEPLDCVRILIGADVMEDGEEDIVWLEDVWDGTGSDALQLVDPDGIVRSMIKVNDEIAESSMCTIM